MILIITHKTDFTADYIINLLNKQGIPYYRLNCENILDEKLSFNSDNGFGFSINGFSKFKAVWFRRTKLPETLSLSRDEDIYILNEIDNLLRNMFSTLDAKWVSDPYSVFKAENKLYQLKTAKEIGFTIPNTLVTTSKEEIFNFFHSYRELIIKPLSQTRITSDEVPQFVFTNRVTSEHIDRLDDYDISPCIFQSLIPKQKELRLTVVGNHVFSAGVDSQSLEETKVDWRRKRLPFFPVEIPDRISRMCVNLVKSLGLEFGAIDMVKQEDGNYVFLEINPNGQWVWIEQQTGLKISEALIDNLTT